VIEAQCAGIERDRPPGSARFRPGSAYVVVMPSENRAKSILASVVGWLIVALIVYWFLGFVVGTIAFMVRFVVGIVLLGLLVAAYVKLSGSGD